MGYGTLSAFGDIKRSAISYCLWCIGVHEKGRPNLHINRTKLKELGDCFKGLGEDGCGILTEDDSEISTLLGNLEGISLAIQVEKEYLASCSSHSVGSRLRDLGVNSLEKLGEVLRSAEDPSKFDEYAEPLAELFKEWHDYAEELTIPVSRGLPCSIGEVALRFPPK